MGCRVKPGNNVKRADMQKITSKNAAKNFDPFQDRALAIEELSESDIRALSEANMDPRHAELDALTD